MNSDRTDTTADVVATLQGLNARAASLVRRHDARFDIDSLTNPTPMAHDAPARQLHGASAILGASVLTDSAIEHYRSGFRNPAMMTPLIASALTVASSLHGMGTAPVDSHNARTTIYELAIGVGAVGRAYHLYNVTKRVGGARLENFFYGERHHAGTQQLVSRYC